MYNIKKTAITLLFGMGVIAGSAVMISEIAPDSSHAAGCKVNWKNGACGELFTAKGINDGHTTEDAPQMPCGKHHKGKKGKRGHGGA